jgi:hypothetical protein
MEFKSLRLFMKNKWWLTSRTTQNTISKHKNFTIFPLILRERDAEKTRFKAAKIQKMANFSWRWNSKFWGYLWRTIYGSHPEQHKTRLRNIKISPNFLLSSEKEMLRKRVFRQRKRRKWPIFHDVRIQNFEVIYWEQVMAHIQNYTKYDIETWNFHHFPLPLREIDDEKTRFQPAKKQKITNFTW